MTYHPLVARGITLEQLVLDGGCASFFFNVRVLPSASETENSVEKLGSSRGR